MVDDPIKHQLVTALQVLTIIPGSQIGIHCFKVDYRKALIRGVRKEGEDVQSIDGPFEVGIAESGQAG